MAQEGRTSGLGRPAGLANLERTRQQIQELDQLLQQMLALPLAEEKPADPSGSPEVRSELGVSPTTQPIEESPERSTSLPSVGFETKGPTDAVGIFPETEAESTESSNLEAVELEEAQAAWNEFEPGTAESTAPRPTYTAAKRRTPSSLPYRTAVTVNSGLERFFRGLGPLGRPFLSPWGREWLGWLGFVLLVAAAALSLGVLLGWNW
ncbi:MAG: hypothetical protein NZM31_11915 [Gemmatales bacterium]|nr:hypothetical protein [Gemmatales bacterium]MDW8387701.1 hypothetical protein [Gemmatales bacterium]